MIGLCLYQDRSKSVKSRDLGLLTYANKVLTFGKKITEQRAETQT